mmetsp:Transcript_35755/g.57825  ORF Transcript_35755/g.57825 Transcript_35755/m.57825 type:complete len:223 (+) Transcript_35755:1468-2136(+)
MKNQRSSPLVCTARKVACQQEGGEDEAPEAPSSICICLKPLITCSRSSQNTRSRNVRSCSAPGPYPSTAVAALFVERILGLHDDVSNSDAYGKGAKSRLNDSSVDGSTDRGVGDGTRTVRVREGGLTLLLLGEGPILLVGVEAEEVFEDSGENWRCELSIGGMVDEIVGGGGGEECCGLVDEGGGEDSVCWCCCCFIVYRTSLIEGNTRLLGMEEGVELLRC